MLWREYVDIGVHPTDQVGMAGAQAIADPHEPCQVRPDRKSRSHFLLIPVGHQLKQFIPNEAVFVTMVSGPGLHRSHTPLDPGRHVVFTKTLEYYDSVH